MRNISWEISKNLSISAASESPPNFVKHDQSLAKVSSSSIFRLLFFVCLRISCTTTKSTNLRLLPVTEHDIKAKSIKAQTFIISQKLGFEESYSVEFSESGKEEATGCGFPDELTSDGRCFWSAKYCCENLLKMTDLDTTGSAIVRNMVEKRRRSDSRDLTHAHEIQDSDSE